MAITQNRIIAITIAARHFLDDLFSLKTETRRLLATLPPKPSQNDLLETIQSIQFALDQFRPAEKDLQLLLAEEAHFKSNFRRNQRAAEYARRRRAGLPTTLKGASNELAESIIAAGTAKPAPSPKNLEKLLSEQSQHSAITNSRPLHQPAAFNPEAFLDNYIKNLSIRDEQTLHQPDAKTNELLASYKPLESDAPPDPDAELF